jgi:hypothetical protein
MPRNIIQITKTLLSEEYGLDAEDAQAAYDFTKRGGSPDPDHVLALAHDLGTPGVAGEVLAAGEVVATFVGYEDEAVLLYDFRKGTWRYVISLPDWFDAHAGRYGLTGIEAL